MLGSMELRERLALPIYDLDCPAAGAAIERQLCATAGVLNAYVNATTEIAYVEYDANQTSPARIAQVIEHAGYVSGPPFDT